MTDNIVFSTKSETRKVKRSETETWEGKVTFPEVDLENSTDENKYILATGLTMKVAQNVKKMLDESDAANVQVREAIELLTKYGALEAAKEKNPAAFELKSLPTELVINLETCQAKPAPRGRQATEKTLPTENGENS